MAGRGFAGFRFAQGFEHRGDPVPGAGTGEPQRAFAERAVKWDMDNNVGRRMAYNFYFGQKAGGGKKA